MANPNIKFFRSNVAPSNPVEGYVWFNTEDRTIQLFKNGDWEVYSGLINATYDNRVLTLTNATGAKVAVDLNDIYDEIAKLEGITDKVTTYVVTAIAQETSAREASDKAINDVLNGTTNDDGSEKTKGLVKEVAALRSEMNALGGIDGGDGIGGMIDAKINALDVTDTAEDGQYVSSVSEVDGKVVVTRAALPDYTNVYETKDTAKTLIEALDANVTSTSDKSMLDINVVQVDGVITEIRVHDGHIEEAWKWAEKLRGTDEGKTAREIAAEEVVKIVNETDNDSIDTLKEITAWIAAHPKDAAEYNARITANEEAIEDLQAGLEEAERVTAESHTNLNGRLETVETWRTGLASEYAAQDGKYIASVKQVDGKVEATYGDLPVIPDVDGMIETAIAGLDSTATASSDYATFTVVEVDGKVVSDGSSISLTVGSLTNNTEGLVIMSDVKAYVDNAWVWGEF